MYKVIYFLALLFFIQPVTADNGKKFNNHYNQEYMSFVIVVPSYNNQNWYEENLASIYSQDYPYFRVIYINDCSKDQTGLLVEDWINKNGYANKTTIIHNKTNQGALYNIYTAVQSCQDHEVIVLVDGDDRLSDHQVLSKLNEVYSREDVWLTYGQFVCSDGYQGCCEAFSDTTIANNTYRESRWRASHLRTFYAGLFKHVKLADFLYGLDFFTVTWDLCFMIPMIEMASRHVKFISDILYIYNLGNPLSDFVIYAEKQFFYHHYFTNHEKYEALKDLSFEQPKKISVINICEKTPFSMTSYQDFLSIVSIDYGITLFNIINTKYNKMMDEVLFSDSMKHEFVYYDEKNATMEEDNRSFYDLIKSKLFSITDDYILFTKNNMSASLGLLLLDAVEIMQKTAVEVIFIFDGEEHATQNIKYDLTFGTSYNFIPKKLENIFMDFPLWGRNCSFIMSKRLFTQMTENTVAITGYNSLLAALNVLGHKNNILSLVAYANK